MNEVTGRLEYWYMDDYTFPGHTVMRGYLFRDTKKRWRGGQDIRTSSVITDSKYFLEGAIISTLNSTYLLGKPLEVGNVE